MYRAFADDPVMRFCIPDDEIYAIVGPPLCRNVVIRGLAQGEVWCLDEGAAFSVWEPPQEGEPTTWGTVEGLETFDVSLLDLKRFDALDSVTMKHRPTQPHWYLKILATEPERQGSGLGGRLLEHQFDRIGDAASFLETETTELVDFYKQHGFEVLSEWNVPLGGPHMWGMWRDGRGR